MSNNSTNQEKSQIFDESSRARDVIQGLLNGGKPNGIDPTTCGVWAQYIDQLIDVHEKSGTAGVRRAFDGLVRHDSKLAQLLAGDLNRTGWEWRNLAQAYEPKPARAYAVEGVLPLPSLSTVYGNPGSLKTMMLMDLALCVVSGKPWLTGLPEGETVRPYATLASPVLWIDIDNGLDRLERRFAALGQAHEISPDAPFSYVSFPTPQFDAQSVESTSYLIKSALEIGAKLIVFDNLGTVSGAVDENSNQMTSVMAGLRNLAEKTRAAVVVIHHKNKGTKERAGDSLRGHSSIEAALDLALMIERDEGSDAVTLRSTKTRDIPVVPVAALWTWDQDERGELKAGRFYGLGRPDDGKESKTEQASEAILSLLAFESGRKQSDLIAEVKRTADVGKNNCLSALKNLERDGVISVGKGDRNASIYNLS